MRTGPNGFPGLSILGLVMLGFGFCALASAPAPAAEKDLTQKGEVIVREHCGRCHAVGLTGSSPNEEAPPFRTLSSKYPIDSLAESLAEGIMSGHPDMPVFVFTPHDVDAIIRYMQSIQEEPGAGPDEPEAGGPAEQQG
ncbi:cytochrome c [Methyloceanibacter sp.]|uniref:c-type cytochrome n=1 Tax=Methyloceanibacter sp. TaxID=1965321 RepID=UPI002C8D137C|nr:cytochrome c [Methyloceanibacter sp.]HML93659.1 cytochrome c [Methyloceanibacter sp.]